MHPRVVCRSAVAPSGFYWDPPNEKAGDSVANRAKLHDAVDLVWCNRVGEQHNINADLWRIQARTMVMHVTNDNWLNFKLAERAVDQIPGADLISEESPVAHYGVFSIINHRKNDPRFTAFMEDVDRLDRAKQYVDKNFHVPGVAQNIDPKESFWKEYVTYPYPVKYADVDGNGTTWQIGYMDEDAGAKPARRSWSSSTARARSAACMATSCSTLCAPASASSRQICRMTACRAGQSGQEPRAHHAGHARLSCMNSWSTSSASSAQPISAIRSAVNSLSAMR
jgi:hypothetical protein